MFQSVYDYFNPPEETDVPPSPPVTTEEKKGEQTPVLRNVVNTNNYEELHDDLQKSNKPVKVDVSKQPEALENVVQGCPTYAEVVQKRLDEALKTDLP